MKLNVMKRLVIYTMGLFLMALGVAFSVNSNLGVSPVNSLPYVISQISGIDLGSCVIVIFCSYLLVQVLLLGRQFRWINLTQVLFSVIFGYFVDLAKWIVGDFALPTYPGRLFMLLISILLVALGVCLYMDVKLINMPMEGMIDAIKAVLAPQKPFHDVKVVMDCLVVAVGGVLSLIFLGGLVGIREGTVLCALLAGRFMKPMQKVLVPLIESFCLEEKGAVDHEESNDHDVTGDYAVYGQSQRGSVWRNADEMDG